jgi:hypothetical protein
MNIRYRSLCKRLPWAPKSPNNARCWADRYSPFVSPWPSHTPWIARRYFDLASLDTFRTEVHAGPRAELAQFPAGVNPFKHSRDEHALQVRASWQRAHLEEAAEPVADRVPARLAGRLQGVEYGSASHRPTVTGRRSGRPYSSPQCNKLYIDLKWDPCPLRGASTRYGHGTQ